MRPLALGTLVFLAGCPQPSAEDSAADASAPARPDAAAALPADAGSGAALGDFAGAACDRLEACALADPGARPDCIAFVEDRSFFGSAATLASVRDGLSGFDPAAWQACLDAIAALPCDSLRAIDSWLSALESACPPAAALPGRVAAGGRCLTSVNCAGTEVACEKDGGCEGVCRSLVRGVGEACDEGHDCDPSTGACAYLDGAGWRCLAWLEAGASCSDGQEATAWCRPGLFCDSATARCLARRGVGGTCSVLGDCLPALRCDAATGRCAEPLAEGAGCLDASQCAEGSTCEGAPLSCEAHLRLAGQTCRAGQACSGSICAGGTCVPYSPAGASCEPTGFVSACAPGLACEGSSATCQPLGGLGDRCDEAASPPGCKLFLACRQGACAQLPRTGEPCANASYPWCAPGSFCDGLDCSDPLPDGFECWSGEECASGFCQSPGEESDAASTCRAGCAW